MLLYYILFLLTIILEKVFWHVLLETYFHLLQGHLWVIQVLFYISRHKIWMIRKKFLSFQEVIEKWTHNEQLKNHIQKNAMVSYQAIESFSKNFWLVLNLPPLVFIEVSTLFKLSNYTSTINSSRDIPGFDSTSSCRNEQVDIRFCASIWAAQFPSLVWYENLTFCPFFENFFCNGLRRKGKNR